MKLTALLAFITGIFLLPLACSKTGGILPPPPPDPCSLITISVNGTVANPSVAGASDGSITLTATGGSGFSFSLNGGLFQSYNKFTNLAAGDYSVVVKNADGCSNSISFTLTNPVVSCNGVNIVVTATPTTNVLCESPTASVSVSASGGVPPYNYKLNTGSWQNGSVFYYVISGSCSITVRDANGCTGSASITVSNAAAGPLFSVARNVIRYNCVYCHSNSNAGGGVSYSDDCSIVSGKDRIKARAVDGLPSPMPQSGLLPASERQKILDWINAGGKYSD